MSMFDEFGTVDDIIKLYPKERIGNTTAVKKAYNYLRSEDHKHADIVKALRLYLGSIDLEDTKYIPWLNNFLLEYYEVYNITKDELDLCDKIIDTWKKKKRFWWATVVNKEIAIKNVISVIKNPFFLNNWEKALDDLRMVMKARESSFLKIIPNFKWFCDIKTITNILEGVYGNTFQEKPKRYQFDDNYGVEPAFMMTTEHMVQMKNATIERILGRTPYNSEDIDKMSNDWFATMSINNNKIIVKLWYRGTLIKTGADSYDKSNPDNRALFKTFQKIADEHNKTNYKPDIQKQREAEIKEIEELI